MTERDPHPTGTVTLLFTDIEGSTRLLQSLGSAYGGLLAEHHRVVRDAVARAGGAEVKTEGDSFFIVFRSSSDAIAAASDAQRGLAGASWPRGATVRVRMGLHTGDVAFVDGEYVGLDVHRAARVAAAAHGGQVLLTETTRSLVASSLPAGVTVRDLGEHHLRDLERPEHLYQLVLEGLAADFPPIRTASARFDVLPRPLTSFIGREAEVTRLMELLRGTRLLTLTGPGGTGKTRLAIESARRLAAGFRDGIAFVPLASLRDPTLVGPTIRQTLGLPEQPGTPAIGTVIEQVRTSEILLVLDNLEQVLPAASAIAELLARTEKLKLLVTSRAPLRISGEQELPVPPLRLPAPADRDDTGLVSQSEAVALFMQRALTVRPDFELTSANARAIVEICERLDGLPLAIELAASRIRMLPPEALLARLSRRLDLLHSSAPDRTDRQRTLRGTIEWSHDLLDPSVRALFRRVAIFLGGFGLEAVEGVVPSAGATSEDVLDGLSVLVDQSLVRQVEVVGEPRFTLLETIRDYGLERLAEAGELELIGQAHARLFLDLAIRLSPEYTRGEAALDRTEREHDNIRAAIRWAAEHDEVELALAASGALWRFWHFRGHLREGRRTLEDLLAEPAAAAATPGRLSALIGLAGLVYWQNEFERSEELYRDAVALAGRLGDVAAEADVLYSLSYLRAIPGDFDAASEMLRESIERFDTIDDRLGVAKSQAFLAGIASLRGDYAEAVRLIDEARVVMREQGAVFLYLNSAIVLIVALLHLGHLEQARRELVEMLSAERDRGDMTAVGMVLRAVASFAALTDHAERSARLLGAIEAMRERLGAQAPPTLVNPPDARPIIDARMDPRDVETAIAAGRALDDAAAIEFGLETLSEAVAVTDGS
jgi:predicted ATPase/class 3 adenylate cyclase